MSRLLDERGRIFGKVNVVDVIVLILIVAIVVFAVARTAGGTSKTIAVDVTYGVEEVRQATVDAVVGAAQTKAVVRDDAGTLLGMVTKVSVAPTQEDVPTAQGELKAVASPVFSDVMIVVHGQAVRVGSSYRIGSVTIGVGKKVTVVGPALNIQTVVLGVKEAK